MVSEGAGRAIVYQRSGGLCEGCGQHRGDGVHHRRGRGQGGTWCPSNLLHLCGSGTTGCHGWATSRPAWSHAAGWTLRHGDVADQVPVYLRTAYGPGWALLDAAGMALHLVTDDPPPEHLPALPATI